MNDPARFVDKVFAYITRGDRLLVFDHVAFPDAGTQVPAGTIGPGEAAPYAVLREAREETGLDRFSESTFLGISRFDARAYGRDELHRRHFFQLSLGNTAPDRWRHYERHPSHGKGPIEFELYWLPISEAALRLAFEHGALLTALSTALPDRAGRYVSPRPSARASSPRSR